MEIPLLDGEPLKFERIVVYPYPDLKRIWVRMWIKPTLEHEPNIDIAIINPDGTANCSASMLAQSDHKLEKTLHMKESVAGETYTFVAQMTLGLTEKPELVEMQEFDMVLEFRNPERKEPGFGIGVDWEEFQAKA